MMTASLSSSLLLLSSLPSTTSLAGSSTLLWSPYSSRTLSSFSSSHGHLFGDSPPQNPASTVAIMSTSTTSLYMSSNAAFASSDPSSTSSSSSNNDVAPLATQGDWSAYPDNNTGEIYYFNHDTGESRWDPPTLTFPIVTAAGGGMGGATSYPPGRGATTTMSDGAATTFATSFGRASSTVDDGGYKVGATTSMGSRMRDGPSFGGKPMAGRSSFGGATTTSMGNRRPVIGENNPFESTSTIIRGGRPSTGRRFVAPNSIQNDEGIPNNGPPPPRSEMVDGSLVFDQRQRSPPTFYEMLRVSPTSTRAQIKSSYLDSTRRLERNGGDLRRSREYNDISRAYMILSDERTRERYDEQLAREEAQRRMRYKMMEEERSWEEERIRELQLRMGMIPGGGGPPGTMDRMGMPNGMGSNGNGMNSMGMRPPNGGMGSNGMGMNSMDMRPPNGGMGLNGVDGMGMRPNGMPMSPFEGDREIRRQKIIASRSRPEMNVNIFTKDASFNKKMDMVDSDGTTNKFNRGNWQKQQSMGVSPGQGGYSGPAARALEVDEEAERLRIMQQRMQTQAQDDADKMMTAMETEQENERRLARRREKEEQARELSALEEEQSAAAARERNQREERRRASSERDVIQDVGSRPSGGGLGSNPNSFFPPGVGAKSKLSAAVVPEQQQQKQQKPSYAKTKWTPPGAQDINAMMASMKEKFSQSKSKVDEAARMKDQLSSLGVPPTPVKEQQSSGSRRKSLLFPGKGGIVVEDSPFVARDILLDQLLDRAGTAGSGKPAFISWVEPEEGQMGVENDSPPPFGAGRGTLSGERERELERVQNIKSKVGAGQPSLQQPPINTRDQQIRGPSSSVQPLMKTSSKAREQERLMGMKARGLGIGVGAGPEQVPVGPVTAGVERNTLGNGLGDPFANSSSKEREQRRLQDMKTVVGPRSEDIRALEEAHRVELAELKRDMQEAADRTLEEEIINIAKIHAAEIIKLRDDFEASRNEAMRGMQQQMGTGRQQSAKEVEAALQQLKTNQVAERDRMTKEIRLELEKSHAEQIRKMEAAHKVEIEKVRSESGSEATSRLQSEISKLKQAHIFELESMATGHDRDMQQLRKELEVKSVELTRAHKAEIQKLSQDQKGASVADTLKFQEVAMAKLSAQHVQEMQSLVAKHGHEMDSLKKDLEAKSMQNVKVKVEEATKAIATQFKADIDKMAAQHKQEMQNTVQGELQKLKQQHVKEMEAALAEKRRAQQQAESVTRELLNADKQGSTITKSDKIEMILKSFDGVYDPNLINQLRKDLNARELELDNQIVESNIQISTLQTRLESSKTTEEKLTNEIRTLSQWKQNAEAELQRVKQGSGEKTAEVMNLNNSIQTMTKEIAGLNAQLDRLTQERDSSKKEIYELREWKKNAEAEREQLEKEIKSKDGVISKLKTDFEERDADVNALVPEVCANSLILFVRKSLY